jgi:2-keto-4-pentenoate hydratase
MTSPAEATQHSISASEQDRMQQAAEILLPARRNLAPVPELPTDLRPRTLEEAYALQQIIAVAFGPVGGWKIGAPSPDATPLCSPMPLWGGYASSGQTISGSLRRLRGVEAEIAFLIGKDLPPREQPWSREEVVDAIAGAHPAIELLESAFADPDKADRLSAIGDLQSNGGFGYGAALPNWAAVDLTRESVTVAVDGAIRFEGTASNSAGTDLLRLVTYLANEGSTRTGGLRAGQWITTGSWSGKTLASAGSVATIRFSTFGEVTLRFE